MIRTLKIMLVLLVSLNFHGQSQSLSEIKLDSVAIKVDDTDPHTYSPYASISVKAIDLKLEVNFEKKVLHGVAEYTLERKKPLSYVVFDTWKIDVRDVEVVSKGQATIATWRLGNFDSILGSPLVVLLNDDTDKIRIKYSTSAGAKNRALVWVDAKSTDNGTHPMLFSQTEPCNLRAFLPSMDSPNTRFTFSAIVTVPPGLMCLMSATNPTQKSRDGKYYFKMEQPIKPYLLSIAVGNFEFAPLTSRAGVYAEPNRLKEAKHSAINVDKIISIAERLCGKYRWGRYDLLFLPSRAYPYFGLENPRLTHVSTLAITKDQSLEFVFAHEVIHSWCGNQNGNANWGSLFINEGLCEYLAMRVMEELRGKEYADLLTYNNIQLVKNQTEPLDLDLQGKDPLNAFGNMRYYGGALFFRNVEAVISRARMNDFIKSYFSNPGYRDYTTQQFLEVLKRHLSPSEEATLDIEKWIHGGGLPSGVVNFSSAKIMAVKSTFDKCMATSQVKKQDFKGWDSHEFRYFFDLIFEGDSLSASVIFGKLIQNPRFDKQQLNAEALTAFYLNAVKFEQSSAFENEISLFLLNTGRIKLIKPLYVLLYSKNEIMATSIYRKARKHYHPQTQEAIDKVIPGCKED